MNRKGRNDYFIIKTTMYKSRIEVIEDDSLEEWAYIAKS